MSLFISLSEWQLRAAHVVVWQPAEALLPDADVHPCPIFIPLSLMLPLWNGIAD